VSRALLLCPEPIREVTAGVGTRFVALARVLAGAGHDVTLAIPNDPSECAVELIGARAVRAEAGRLGLLAAGHDWVLIHGHLGNHYLHQRDDLPVVVDLYDPFLVENLHYHRDLGLEPYRSDHATWTLQMGRGDLFLCSSPEQRMYYLGWLTALGRVHPLRLEDDPRLDHLIVEVPFGCPSDAPPEPSPRPDVLAGVDDDAPVLYFGGIYDWYDPVTAIEAMRPLLARDPRTVLVFVEHPHPDLTPQSAAARARRLADRNGWTGGAVRFEAWREPHRRHELPSVANVAVVTHTPGFETDLSLRTRLVDLMWLGVPAVVTEGGTMARVVAQEGAGTTVPPGNPEAVAAAVAALLDDPGAREAASLAGRRWSRSRTWDRVAEPLLRFAASPTRDTHRDRFRALGPHGVEASEPVGDRVRRWLRRLAGGR
jgi:glycosyltransferase involved in cell wall biosynthesis